MTNIWYPYKQNYVQYIDRPYGEDNMQTDNVRKWNILDQFSEMLRYKNIHLIMLQSLLCCSIIRNKSEDVRYWNSETGSICSHVPNLMKFSKLLLYDSILTPSEVCNADMRGAFKIEGCEQCSSGVGCFDFQENASTFIFQRRNSIEWLQLWMRLNYSCHCIIIMIANSLSSHWKYGTAVTVRFRAIWNLLLRHTSKSDINLIENKHIMSISIWVRRSILHYFQYFPIKLNIHESFFIQSREKVKGHHNILRTHKRWI